MRLLIIIGLLVFLLGAIVFQIDALYTVRVYYQRTTTFCILADAYRTKMAQSPRADLYQAGQKFAYAEDYDIDPGWLSTRRSLLNYALSPAVVNESFRSPWILVLHADPASADNYAKKHGLTLVDQLDDRVRVYEKKGN